MTEDELQQPAQDAPIPGRSVWGRRFTAAIGLLLVLGALPALFVSVATLTGIGLGNNLQPIASLLGALTLCLLPALGLGSLLGRALRSRFG